MFVAVIMGIVACFDLVFGKVVLKVFGWPIPPAALPHRYLFVSM